jgi:hypothetical protein
VSQQVNLYQPVFRKQQRVFSSRAMLTGVTAVGLGLMLIYGYGRWEVHGLQRDLIGLQGQRAAATKQLLGLKELIPARGKSQLLDAEVARTERELERKRQAAALLSGGGLGNTSGFSGFLAGLARQHLDGLWLTGVRIAEGGVSLTISGRALSPERIPAFVQRLTRESAFAGRHFDTLKMERPEKDGDAIEFVLGTVAEE